MAAGIAGVAAVLMPTVPVAVAPVAWGLAGLGIGVAYSTTALVVLESAPPGEEGGASAALQLGNVLGIALGTGAGGAVLARATAAGGSTGGAIAISHAIAWLAAVAAIALAVRLRGRSTRR
jgi:MFS family permease